MALRMSLLAMGPGAAAAMTASASLVISDAFSTASTAPRRSSWPSMEASQRRTWRTSSSCVSPSKLKDGMNGRLPPAPVGFGDQDEQLVEDAGRRPPTRLTRQLEEVHRPLADA